MPLNHTSIFATAQIMVVFGIFQPRLPGLPTALGACIVICANCPKRIYEICPRRSLSTSDRPCSSLQRHLIQQVVLECYIPYQRAHIKRHNLSLSNGINARALALRLQEQTLHHAFRKKVDRFLHVGHFPDWIGLVSIWIKNRLLNYTTHRSKYF